MNYSNKPTRLQGLSINYHCNKFYSEGLCSFTEAHIKDFDMQAHDVIINCLPQNLNIMAQCRKFF